MIMLMNFVFVLCISVVVCFEDYDDATTTTTTPALTTTAPAPIRCGLSNNIAMYEKVMESGNLTRTRRNIGGCVSEEGAWPFVVELFTANSTKRRCTGTIVHERWILTALHCIVDNSTTINHGSRDHKRELPTSVDRVVEYQPECDKISSVYCRCCENQDLQLVKLKEPLELDEVSLGKICLRKRNFTEEPGDVMVSAGYGRTRDGADGTLRETVFAVDETDLCTDLGNKPLPDKMFCAGDTVHNYFNGDSGGPVMTIRRGEWYQEGLASAQSLDKDGFPWKGYFMRVQDFCSWIRKSTEDEVFCKHT